jgi:uncharacterized protein (DUF1778 family)
MTEGMMSESTERRGAAEPLEGKGTVTYSVRFTEEQRALLQKAAALRGWSPTALVRTAALERAAHIVNANTQTKLDFRLLAVELAKVLFAPRTVRQFDPEGNVLKAAAVPDLSDVVWEHYLDKLPPVEVTPWGLSVRDLKKLEKAALFGGGEFLAMVVAAGHSLTAEGRDDLPEPIDPSALSD